MRNFSLGNVLLLGAITGISGFAQAPTGLSVRAASNKKIDLAWSGAGPNYTVQRRTLGGAYGNLATVTTAAYSDTTIDAYTTYQYQVVANLTAGASAPSNQVTAGPPSAGISVLSQAPPDAAGAYGYDLSMALDPNGDPAFAFIHQDPNTDSDYSDSILYFRSWNRVAYSWNPLVKVATIGDAATYFHNTLSLACDSSTGAFAIFTEFNQGAGVRLYASTDGATWSLKTTYTTAGSGITAPVVALTNGNVFLASNIDSTGIRYVTGQLSANPSTWLSKTSPTVANTYPPPPSTTIAIAVDSAGNPGIAYWVDDAVVSYNRVLLYWRPAGSATPVRIMDSQGRQSDGISVRMVYRNLNPRVIAYVQRDDADFGVAVHFAKSDDGGNTWPRVIVIPPDGNSSTDAPFDLAIDSADHGAVGFGQNGGTGNNSCFGPKLATSANLATWKTCGIPGATSTGNFTSYSGAVALAYGGNDKLYYAWWDHQASPAGVYLYREPPAGANNSPSISTVVNGATFQPGIVAGSWTTITGANLSDTSRTWQDSDFANGSVLPTTLSGVSVKINGLNAPVYYISPTQLNVQAPAGISGSVPVVVTKNGAISASVNATVAANAPGLFTYTLGGKNFPSALYNGTYTIVGDPALYGAAAKAKAGDIIQLYATGLGASPAGNIVSSTIAFNGAVTATVGNATASVQFAGLVGVGLFQVNIIVPSGLADGDYPLIIKANNVSSQTGVTIPITH
ncbi:MAG: IPT/TIG domain-containing protein [Candidatus Solibacter sp.]